jgi:hypothetical protein
MAKKAHCIYLEFLKILKTVLAGLPRCKFNAKIHFMLLAKIFKCHSVLFITFLVNNNGRESTQTPFFLYFFSCMQA